MNLIDKVKHNNLYVFKLIENAIKNNKVAHSIIFSGMSDINIIDEPQLIINSIIEKNISDIDHSNYPDLHIIDGSNGIIKKETIIKSFENISSTALSTKGVKILFIKNIENGNKQSLNSLLKFIEEPTKDTYIIMTTNNISRVLSTIKSRSQIVNIKPRNIDILEEEVNTIDIKIKSIVCNLVDTKKQAIALAKSKVFNDLLINILEALNNGVNNPSAFTTKISFLINKSNYKNTLDILKIFFNDIWKKQANITTSFKDIKLIDEYKNYDYSSGLMKINEFIDKINKNANFELAKTKLLIELEKNYE